MTTITLPRATVEQALEALKKNTKHLPVDFDYHFEALAALRAALAQQAEPDAYGYASRLAVALWEKHYKDIAPQWKPLDDLMGVLTQIDNMTSGLTRLEQQAEPVALKHRHEWFSTGGMEPGQFRCIHCGVWAKETNHE